MKNWNIEKNRVSGLLGKASSSEKSNLTKDDLNSKPLFAGKGIMSEQARNLPQGAVMDERIPDMPNDPAVMSERPEYHFSPDNTSGRFPQSETAFSKSDTSKTGDGLPPWVMRDGPVKIDLPPEAKKDGPVKFDLPPEAKAEKKFEFTAGEKTGKPFNAAMLSFLKKNGQDR